MRNSDQVTFQLLYIRDQKLLTHGWGSTLGDGSIIVTSVFAYRGGQSIDHGLMSLHRPWIVQDEWPKIIDTPLTLISRMGHKAFGLPFYL